MRRPRRNRRVHSGAEHQNQPAETAAESSRSSDEVTISSMEALCSRILSPDDRISRLPDPVICHILSFLEMKLVVATSILSQRWKFLWTGVTALDFKEGKFFSNGMMNFVQFVDKVLLELHDVKFLEKFRLIGRKGCKREPVCVNRWISYAVVRNVKSLTVRVNSAGINLPGALFTSAALAYLSLYGKFKLKLPLVVCLPKLEGLELDYLLYESDECFSKLISGCTGLHSLSINRNSQDKVVAFRVSNSSLKDLEIQFYPDHDNPDEIIDYGGIVAIDAPNLEYLVLRDRISCEFSITRLTSAKSVEIDVDYAKADATAESVIKLVEALNNVNFLKLEGSIMNDLSWANIPMSVAFERLTKLEIECQCCHWSYLSVLLCRLMKLEILHIERQVCYKENHKVCWKDPTEVPVCLSTILARVSVSPFDPLEDVMEMISYFLTHGAVLKLIDLKTYSRDVDYKLEVLKEVSMISRLSSDCSIKFS